MNNCNFIPLYLLNKMRNSNVILKYSEYNDN